MSEQLQDLTLVFKTIGFKAGTGEVTALRQALLGASTAAKGFTGTARKGNRVLVDHGQKTRRVTSATKDLVAENKRLTGQVASLTGKGGQGFLGLNDSLDKVIKKVALWTVATGAIFGTIRSVKALGETITEHDTQMTALRKVYSGAESDLAMIERVTLQTSRAMQSLTGAAFEAAATVARTGRVGLDVTRLTEAALAAQNIAELDAAKAILFLNSAMIQFNQTTDQTIRVLDEWNELSNKTPATTLDLAMAVSVAGSVFEQAGASIQFLNANTAALVEITAKSGNIIGRAERTMAIFSQRQSTANMLARLGIRIFEGVNEQFIGIDELLARVAVKWETLNDRQRAALAQAMAGARQQQFFIALMENQDLVVRNLVTQWGSFGSAMKENEEFLQSISKRTDGLINALERLAIGIGDQGARGIMKGMIETLTTMVNALNDANFALSATAAMAGFLAAQFAILHAAMGVWGALSLAIGVFFSTLIALNAALNTNVALMREQEETLRNNTRALGMQQSRLQSITSTLENLQAAREQLNKEESESVKLNERIAQVLAGLKNIYPTLTDDLTSLNSAYGLMSEKLFEVNKQLAQQRRLLLELEITQLKEKLQPLADLISPPALRQGRPLDAALQDAAKLLETFEGPMFAFSREDLMAALSILNEISAKQAEMAAIAVGAPGGGGGGGPVGGTTSRQLQNLLDQQQLLQWILDGKREEWVIVQQIAILTERGLNMAMTDTEIERNKLRILHLQVRQQQMLLQNAAEIAAIFSRGIGEAIASGFESDGVNRAMHGMVRGFGDLLGAQVAESMALAMVASGASELAIGLTTGGVTGIITGLFGLVANTLFGKREGEDRQVDATEENTIQLRALTDNIQDLTSFFINAPAGFVVPTSGFNGGGAAAIAGGGGAQTNQQGNVNSLSIESGAIQITQQPGQSATDVADQVQAALVRSWEHGAHSEQTF